MIRWHRQWKSKKNLAFTAKKLNETIDMYGSDSAAVFGAPKMTNEKLYVLQKFARTRLKTNNIDGINNLLNSNSGKFT